MDYEILNNCGTCGDGGECTDEPKKEGEEEVKEEGEAVGEEAPAEEEKKEEEAA